MKTKHTEAPWKWQKFGDNYCLVAQHGMREIILAANKKEDSEITYVSMNDDGILNPVNLLHPNSKLIAVAPDLLEMLIKIYQIENHAFSLKGFDVVRLKEEVGAAINKATL